MTLDALALLIESQLRGEDAAVHDAIRLLRMCATPRPELLGTPFETLHEDVSRLLVAGPADAESENARVLASLQSVAEGGANRALARAMVAIFEVPTEPATDGGFELFAPLPVTDESSAIAMLDAMLNVPSAPAANEFDLMAGLLAEAQAPTPEREPGVLAPADLISLPPAERARALHARIAELIPRLRSGASWAEAIVQLRADQSMVERLLWRSGYKTYRSLADACDEALATQLASREPAGEQLVAELQFISDLTGRMIEGTESKRRTYYDHIEILNALRIEIEERVLIQREARREERQAQALAMQDSAKASIRDTSKLSRLQLVFLREMSQHLNSMTRDLLVAEKEPGNHEVIFSLMRSAHSIKGGGAVAKYDAIARFAHHVEDLLVAFRDNTLRLTPAAIGLTLRGVDALQIMLEEAERGDAPDGALTAQITPQFAELTAHVLANLEMYRDAPEEAERSARANLGLGPVAAETERTRKAETRYVTVDIAQLDTLMNLAADLTIGRTRLVANIETMRTAVEALGDFRHAMLLLDRQFRPALSETIAGSAAPLALIGHSHEHERRTGHLTDFESGEFARFTKLDVWRRDLREELNRLDIVSDGLGEFSTEIDQTVALVSQIANDLQESITRTRMIPLGQVFERFPRAIRDLAEQLGKQVTLELRGGETPLDKTVIEELSDPLMHILRNAVDHGLESPSGREAAGKLPAGRIVVAARQTGNRVVIEIRDDGGGIDPSRVRAAAIAKGILSEDEASRASDRDLIDLLAQPGFSTAEKVTDVSGRGVGLDVVAGAVRALHGTFAIQSQVGAGTTFTLTLPTTLAITQALLFHCAGERFALPLNTVLEVVRLDHSFVHRIEGFPVLRLREALIPLVDLRSALGLLGEEGDDEPQVIVIGDADARTGLVVGSLIGREEIVVKNLGYFLARVPFVSGATILADGVVTLILDAHELSAVSPEVRTTISNVSATTLAPSPKPVTPLKPKAPLHAPEPRPTSPRRTAKAEPVPSSRPAPPTREVGAEKSAPSPARPAPVPERGSRTGNHVLVVDDSASIRTYVVAILESAGFKTTSAVDGVDALDKLARTEFDLILTDLEMPRMHGFELIAEVKNAHSHAHIPIVILTGRMGEKHSRKGLELGAVAFLVKPFDETELLDTIRQFILKSRP